MAHIRSALAAVALVCGAAVAASAQQPAPAHAPGAQAQGPHGRHRPKGEWGGRKHRGALLRGITLSASEKANVKAVHEKYAPQMKALRAQPKSDSRREQAKQLMTAARGDMRAALTPANQVKFDANIAQLEQRMAKHKAQHKANGGGRRAPGGAPGL